MAKAISVLVMVVALAGCAVPAVQQQAWVSACAAGEATYACQVERYHNINVP